MIEKITVVLLAGGKSRRFWPLKNKMQVQFLGKSFLDRQIDFLRQVGLKNIVVVVREENKPKLLRSDVEWVSQEGEGQGAAVLSASMLLQGKPLLVINADDVVSKELFKNLDAVIHENQHILVGFKTTNYFPGGYLVLDGKRVAKVVEKPGEGNEPSSFVKLVCDYFTNADKLLSFLREVSDDDRKRHYELALSEMIAGGERFELLEYTGKWLPLKYPWQTLSLMHYYFKQIKKSMIHKTAQVHKTATIVGPVVLEKDVRVMEYAKLVGPLYVGSGTIIGNHVLVRSSIVGSDCVVGYNCDITGSYIGRNCWFHSNYVGDCVIADGVAMGAGAVLANLRLDEEVIYSKVLDKSVSTGLNKFGAIIGEGSRIGVESQLMPGVKVGKHSFVGPGVLLHEDLAEHRTCYVKQELVYVENKVTSHKDREQFRKALK